MTEAGLVDYLVLLSLFQTCRYKGASFYKFLLSRGSGTFDSRLPLRFISRDSSLTISPPVVIRERKSELTPHSTETGVWAQL
jgi:hypothetical protein